MVVRIMRPTWPHVIASHGRRQDRSVYFPDHGRISVTDGSQLVCPRLVVELHAARISAAPRIRDKRTAELIWPGQ